MFCPVQLFINILFSFTRSFVFNCLSFDTESSGGIYNIFSVLFLTKLLYDN